MKSRARAAKDSTKRAARRTQRSAPFRILTRMGFAVNGLIHVLIGVIAVQVALGGASDKADHSGALEQMAAAPGGVFLLWVVTVGLAALGASAILEAFTTPALDTGERTAAILKNLGKGVVYFALASTALTFARGGSTDSEQSSRKASSDLLSLPGGVVIATLIGASVVAIGLYFIVKGVRRTFTEDVAVPQGSLGTAITIFGVAGYLAKGIALGVVGVLFVVAAFAVDPKKAAGIDGALKSLVGFPFGGALLIIVGAGLVAYGLYSFLRARYAKI